MVVRFLILERLYVFTSWYAARRRCGAKTYRVLEYAGFGMFFCEGGECGVPC
jgi:hypothetical protein